MWATNNNIKLESLSAQMVMWLQAMAMLHLKHLFIPVTCLKCLFSSHSRSLLVPVCLFRDVATRYRKYDIEIPVYYYHNDKEIKHVWESVGDCSILYCIRKPFICILVYLDVPNSGCRTMKNRLNSKSFSLKQITCAPHIMGHTTKISV